MSYGSVVAQDRGFGINSLQSWLGDIRES